MYKDFIKELENLINRYSIDNDLNTPDFILAAYLDDCLKSYKKAVAENYRWHADGSLLNQTKVPF